ncbi:MAG: hypothetical protein ACTHJY_23815 [Rhizobiaceae bacterium]
MTATTKADTRISDRELQGLFTYLNIKEESRGVEVTLVLPTDNTDILLRRLRKARRLFVRSMAKHDVIEQNIEGGAPYFVFTPQGREELYKSCRRLDSRLAALIEEPITGKVVDHLLGISAAERRRWSKDGRLTPCGSRTSRRGRARFNFPIFSLNRIEMLRNEPELIERWREQDEARKLPESGFVLESAFDHIWT